MNHQRTHGIFCFSLISPLIFLRRLPDLLILWYSVFSLFIIRTSPFILPKFDFRKSSIYWLLVFRVVLFMSLNIQIESNIARSFQLYKIRLYFTILTSLEKIRSNILFSLVKKSPCRNINPICSAVAFIMHIYVWNLP